MKTINKKGIKEKSKFQAPFHYRAKLFVGHIIVLKEDKNKAPVSTEYVKTWQEAVELAEKRNKQIVKVKKPTLKKVGSGIKRKITAKKTLKTKAPLKKTMKVKAPVKKNVKAKAPIKKTIKAKTPVKKVAKKNVKTKASAKKVVKAKVPALSGFKKNLKAVKTSQGVEYHIKDVYGVLHQFITRKTANYFIKTHPNDFK